MKKICILYGNCHMANVKEGLYNNTEFRNNYNIYEIFIVDANIDELIESDYFKKCALFIHQAIQEKNNFGMKFSSEYLCKKLPPKCKKIAIPNLYWLPTVLFPQAKKGGEIFSTKALLWQMEFYEDELIEMMLSDGKTVREIVNKYKETGKNTDVKYLWNGFIGKIIKREQEWDIKISSYILKMYKNEYLFYDPGHPTETITAYYVVKILETLGYKCDSTTIKRSISPLAGKQMPIYNSVSDVLGLPADARLRCKDRYITFLPGNMNINKYVIQYCAVRWKRSKRQKVLLLITLVAMHIIGPINMMWKRAKKHKKKL